MSDASFEDGAEKSLRLKAETPEDVQVISALIQDAVVQTSDISWQPKRQRLTLLLNRFRWEDRDAAKRAGRQFERVRSMLVIDSVLQVSSDGVVPGDKETILSILELEFKPETDGTGQMLLMLAGDGAFSAKVECVDVLLQDVSRPYFAQSKSAPDHGDTG